LTGVIHRAAFFTGRFGAEKSFFGKDGPEERTVVGLFMMVGVSNLQIV